MRAILLAAVVAFAGLAPAPPRAAAAITSPFAAVETQPVAPGVGYQRGTAAAAAGPLSVNVVDVDLAAPDISLETSHAYDRVNAREQPTAQGARRSSDGHRVVATINGSNFGSPDGIVLSPYGLMVSGGELTAAGFRRSGDQLVALGLDSHGQPIVGAPRVSIAVSLPSGGVVAVARVNQPGTDDEAVLYTPRFDDVTPAHQQGIEIVLGGVELPLRVSGRYSGGVSEVRRGAGGAALGPGTLVISAGTLAADAFAAVSIGDELTIGVAIDSGWEDVVQAVGGREVLLRRGIVDIFPTDGRKFSTPEPRSAIGYTVAGRMIIVTVDGRQAHSRGVTIPELAELMKQLGAVEAINLDGGGSTMMAVRRPGSIEASIVNKPSEGEERAVNNAVHVVSTVPTGPLSAVLVTPAMSEVAVGQTRQYSFRGHDVAYNGIVPDLGPVSWSTSNGRATITTDGLLTGASIGSVTVRAAAGSWSAGAAVTIVASPPGLTVSPPQVTMLTGVTSAKKKLKLLVTWTAANPQATVTRIELQRRVNSGNWKGLTLASAAPMSVRGAFSFGPLHQLRVRATDSSGSRSAWVLGMPFRLLVYDDNHVQLRRAGSWTTVASTEAIGGGFALGKAAGAGMSLAAISSQVSVVGHRGPKHGSVRVGFESSTADTIGLRSGSMLRRRVLWVGVPPGRNDAVVPVLTITNVSSGRLTRVDIDAVIVLVH